MVGLVRQPSYPLPVSIFRINAINIYLYIVGEPYSVNIGAFNKNLKALKVLGYMHNSIHKGLVRESRELLNVQDKVVCSQTPQGLRPLSGKDQRPLG